MTLFESPRPLQWGAIDTPLLGILHDWRGEKMHHAPGFALVCDAERLWFVASHRQAARIHPQARPNKFQAELWKYDVAELFLADPRSGRYFEFNLAPNGAWWSCEFIAPRVRADEVDIPFLEARTFAELAPDGSWVAALALPLDLLRARLDFGPSTCANVTFILESPAPKFLSAAKLSDGEPDFHLPQAFPPLERRPLPDLSTL